METADVKAPENQGVASLGHGECLSCGRALKAPKDRMRMEDGRCLCAACYCGFLQPGAEDRIPESMV